MPELMFEGRKLVYAEFGAGKRIAGTPTILMPSTEYRDTETLVPIFSQFPDTADIVVLDNTNLGQATRLDAPVSTETILEEIRFAIEALEIRAPVLVGYCATAEMALYAARELHAAGAILFGPLVHHPESAFVEFLYATLQKAILDGDTYWLNVTMNLLDPHATGFRRERAWAMSQYFAHQAVLQDKEHFWLKTMQTKPKGQFQWEDLPKLDFPIRIIRGAHDPAQLMPWLTERLTRPEHDLIQVDCGHQVLNDRLEETMAHMLAFADELTARRSVSGTAA